MGIRDYAQESYQGKSLVDKKRKELNDYLIANGSDIDQSYAKAKIEEIDKIAQKLKDISIAEKMTDELGFKCQIICEVKERQVKIELEENNFDQLKMLFIALGRERKKLLYKLNYM